MFKNAVLPVRLSQSSRDIRAVAVHEYSYVCWFLVPSSSLVMGDDFLAAERSEAVGLFFYSHAVFVGMQKF
jgi:hypothetical protein